MVERPSSAPPPHFSHHQRPLVRRLSVIYSFLCFCAWTYILYTTNTFIIFIFYSDTYSKSVKFLDSSSVGNTLPPDDGNPYGLTLFCRTFIWGEGGRYLLYFDIFSLYSVVWISASYSYRLYKQVVDYASQISNNHKLTTIFYNNYRYYHAKKENDFVKYS